MQDKKSPPMKTLTLPGVNNTQSVQGRTVISNGNSQLERQRAHAPVNSYLLLPRLFCSRFGLSDTRHLAHKALIVHDKLKTLRHSALPLIASRTEREVAVGGGENYVIRSFMICTPRQIRFG